MPSAANGKSEKPASSETLDNSPIRQVMTIIEHKIRNLEKRKGKLDQYRNLQKAGKDLEREQKIALTKWDEVNQTLEFSREFSKQITQIAISAERDAKKQAKRDAWVRYAADANKIREVLLVLDCLNMMGSEEVREDFLNGANGAAKLTQEDLRILDDLYPEVTPKHEPNNDGQPGFHVASAKAAEHLCSITEGKTKEVLGTTYTHIKEIVAKVHGCGYFDKVPEPPQPEEVVEPEPEPEPVPVQQQLEPEVVEVINEAPSVPAGFAALPVPPVASVVPTPGYPLCPLPPITLQEVEHAYFAHQYPQQRPIAEVIGSQNFFFLQESELDSPNGTPQPPMQPSPPQGIPTQTFTNQHFIPGHEQMPPQPHFAPIEHGFPPGAVIMPHMVQHPHQQLVNHVSPQGTYAQPAPVPAQSSPAHMPAPAPQPHPPHQPQPPQQQQPPQPQQPESRPAASPENDKPDDEWKETRSPERDDNGDRRTQGQGDGQNRYRRYPGSGRGGRGAPNGHGRGRGSFRQGDGYRGRDSDGYRGRNSDGNRSEYQGRNSDGYQGRNSDGYQGRNSDGYQGRNSDANRSDYQGRNTDGYQGRQNKDRNYDNYQSRSRNNDDGYYGNGDTGDDRHERSRDHVENGRDGHYRDGRDRDGYKGRGRGGPRANRPPRTNNYSRKQEE